MKLITSIFLFLTCSALVGQVGFSKVYDDRNNYEGLFSIIETSDGNYVAVGSTSNVLSGTGASYMVKLGPLGDTLWTRTFLRANSGTVFYDVVEKNNGNYVVCGGTRDTTNTNSDALLMEITPQGDSVWLRRYGNMDNQWVEGLSYHPDVGFVAAGITYDSAAAPFSDAWIFKTDTLGNLQWSLQHDQYGLDDFFDDVTFTSSGEIIAAGVTVISSVNGLDFFGKYDSLGNVIWLKEYGGVEAGGVFSIGSTSEGGCLFGGGIQVSGEIFGRAGELDSLGNLLWANNYSTDIIIGIDKQSNGNIIVCGSTIDSVTSEPRAFMMGLTSSGDSIWSRTYTHYGGSSEDYPLNIIVADDGAYVMCGYIINNPLPEKNDGWIVKTDSLGCIIPGCAVGLDDLHIKHTFEMFPNPANSNLVLKVNMEEANDVIVTILDVAGKLIHTVTYYQLSEAHFLNLDVRDFASGIYTVNVQAGVFVTSKSLIVE